MNNETKISDLTVGEFRQLMQECLKPYVDAEKEVERLRNDFLPSVTNVAALEAVIAKQVAAYDAWIAKQKAKFGNQV